MKFLLPARAPRRDEDRHRRRRPARAAACSQLARAGHEVHVFDPAAHAEARGAAGWTAAGMLSPVAELECADENVFRLGLRTMELWPQRSCAAAVPVECAFDGSLLLAHRGDEGAARRSARPAREQACCGFAPARHQRHAMAWIPTTRRGSTPTNCATSSPPVRGPAACLAAAARRPDPHRAGDAGAGGRAQRACSGTGAAAYGSGAAACCVCGRATCASTGCSTCAAPARGRSCRCAACAARSSGCRRPGLRAAPAAAPAASAPSRVPGAARARHRGGRRQRDRKRGPLAGVAAQHGRTAGRRAQRAARARRSAHRAQRSQPAPGTARQPAAAAARRPASPASTACSATAG